MDWEIIPDLDLVPEDAHLDVGVDLGKVDHGLEEVGHVLGLKVALEVCKWFLFYPGLPPRRLPRGHDLGHVSHGAGDDGGAFLGAQIGVWAREISAVLSV
ncbi:unnamed protein product [Sphagnum tenellum]